MESLEEVDWVGDELGVGGDVERGLAVAGVSLLANLVEGGRLDQEDTVRRNFGQSRAAHAPALLQLPLGLPRPPAGLGTLGSFRVLTFRDVDFEKI